MCHVDLGHRLEQLAGEMGWISVTGRRHVDLCRISLGVGNEFGKRLGRNGWMHQYDKGATDHANDRDVPNEIETELVIQCRVDRGSRVKPEQRMAVGWRTHDRFGAGIAGCAGPVLNYEWLAEHLCERLSQQADEDVRAPTSRIADDPAYRSRWIGLRASKARRYREHGSACGQMQEVAAWKFHNGLRASAASIATRSKGEMKRRATPIASTLPIQIAGIRHVPLAAGMQG